MSARRSISDNRRTGRCLSPYDDAGRFDQNYRAVCAGAVPFLSLAGNVDDKGFAVAFDKSLGSEQVECNHGCLRMKAENGTFHPS